jgi:predicted outer membrane protein
MKCVSVCVLAAAAALLWAGAARAERESEYASPGVGGAPKPPPRLAPAARASTFAPASVATARPMAQEQRDERRFLKDAAAANRLESDASRMALNKSNDPRVRSFAATVINHHAAVATELQHMLHIRGMAPPMLANDQRKTLNRLAKLNGTKFDREYMEEVGLRYQQGDVQLYEKASLTTRDPVLKAWIDRNLPTLQYHLTTAERVVSTPRTKLVKSGAPRAETSSQAPQRQAATQTKRNSTAASPALATQFMGGSAMQLGPTQPIAAHPTEANSR